MKSTSMLISTVLLLMLTTLAHAANGSVITVKLVLLGDINSASARAGQRVDLQADQTVYVDGKEVIRKGAHAAGRVDEVRRRGHNRRDGKIVLAMVDIVRADGSIIPLRSVVRKGTGHGQPVFGPCTFPIPSDPIGLFRRGHDVLLPMGMLIDAAILQ